MLLLVAADGAPAALANDGGHAAWCQRDLGRRTATQRNVLALERHLVARALLAHAADVLALAGGTAGWESARREGWECRGGEHAAPAAGGAVPELHG
jgi:hypothetical protein